MCGSGTDNTKYKFFSHCSCFRIVKVVFLSLEAINRVAATCLAHAVKETKLKESESNGLLNLHVGEGLQP